MDSLPKIQSHSIIREKVGQDVVALRDWTNRSESRDLARQLINETRFQMFYFGTVKRKNTKVVFGYWPVPKKYFPWKHRQYVDCSLRQGGVIREDGGNESGPDAFDNSDEELEDDDTGIVPLLESELYPNSKIFRRQNCLGKRKREESVREWLGYTVENDPAPEYSAMLQIGTELLQACPELYIDKIRKLRRVLDGSATPADRVIKDCPEPQLLGLYDISNTLHELIHRTWSRRSHHLLSPMSSTVLIKREPDDQGTNPSSSVVNKGPTIPGDLCTLTKKELGASLQGMLTHLHFLKYSGSLTEDNPKATSADMLDWRDVLVAGKAYGIPDPVLKRCYLRMARLTPDNAFTIKEFIRRGPANSRNELLVNPIDNF